MPENWQFEIVKLALQLGGALLIARMAVRWALARYKSEKLWERQTLALAEVLQAVTELDRINSVYFHAEITHSQIENDVREALWKGIQAAEKQFQKVAATAAIILPASMSLTIEKIEKDYYRTRESQYDDFMEQLEAEAKLFSEARESLVRLGQRFR